MKHLRQQEREGYAQDLERSKGKYELDLLEEDGDCSSQSGRIFGPKGSPYEGGIFPFVIDFSPAYPQKPSGFAFRTKIFHPDVSEEGRIRAMESRVGLIGGDWSRLDDVEEVLEEVWRRRADLGNYDRARINASNQLCADLFLKQPKVFWARAKADTLTYGSTPCSLEFYGNKFLKLAEKEGLLGSNSAALREIKLSSRMLSLNKAVSLRAIKLVVDGNIPVNFLRSLAHVSHLELHFRSSSESTALFALGVELKPLTAGGCNFIVISSMDVLPVVMRSFFSTLQKYHGFCYGNLNQVDLIPDTMHLPFFSGIVKT